MRRFVCLFAAALLLCLCVCSVSAVTVPEVSSHGTVDRDGR